MLGSNCIIHSGAVIGPQVTIDDCSQIWPCCWLEHCKVGAHCVVQAGAQIGTQGALGLPCVLHKERRLHSCQSDARYKLSTHAAPARAYTAWHPASSRSSMACADAVVYSTCL
eukprot:jgi/Chrzof1/8430/Cz03g10120.t1